MPSYECPLCHSEYSSPFAMDACEIECVEADRHARQELRGRAK